MVAVLDVAGDDHAAQRMADQRRPAGRDGSASRARSRAQIPRRSRRRRRRPSRRPSGRGRGDRARTRPHRQPPAAARRARSGRCARRSHGRSTPDSGRPGSPSYGRGTRRGWPAGRQWWTASLPLARDRQPDPTRDRAPPSSRSRLGAVGFAKAIGPPAIQSRRCRPVRRCARSRATADRRPMTDVTELDARALLDAYPRASPLPRRGGRRLSRRGSRPSTASSGRFTELCLDRARRRGSPTPSASYRDRRSAGTARGRPVRRQGHLRHRRRPHELRLGDVRHPRPGRPTPSPSLACAGAGRDPASARRGTHEFAWGITSVNRQAGTPRNPADPHRVAGGSSGGSGVALASSQVPIALGIGHRRIDPDPGDVLRRRRTEADLRDRVPHRGAAAGGDA